MNKPLLPENRTDDFFVCDVFDSVLKGDMASMEHPIFSLSTKPDHKPRQYQHPNGTFITVNPGHHGLATVFDRDILIYCISQLVNQINQGQVVSKNLSFKAYDLLKATNRTTDGRGYKNLKAALERLQSTQIETNIETGGIEEIDIFSLIDRVKIIRKTRNGRMLDIRVTLSDWVFNAIKSKEVLTLHKDYFRLRKPLERRLYEIARKHCGKQKEWLISLELLYKKTGSRSKLKEFRRLLNTIISSNKDHHHIPDYEISRKDNNVIFNYRIKNITLPIDDHAFQIKLQTIENAKKIVGRTFDVYALEAEWREWAKTLKVPPESPDGAFIGFCKKKIKEQNSS